MRKAAGKLKQIIWQDQTRIRKMQVGVAACLLFAAIVWFWPSRIAEIVRFDGEGRWKTESAPPRRLIVWQPAEPLPLLMEESESITESISPALTDGGATLYFSRRRAGEPAEIVRTRFVDGKWKSPEVVRELNSPADDMGPVLSRDGSELYLFSNRPGGRGGYDLYVSIRQPSGWSTPRNLGPRINTPANEYDPCLDPAGTSLFFASNRTRQMASRVQRADDNSVQEWAGTLRAETGRRTYDLYRAHRRKRDAAWVECTPVESVNRPDSDEGAPHISPDGAFLYFASNRPARPDEAPNLDLYRVRFINGETSGALENLGEGINSAAHETEPSLSPEGFRLLFASNRGGADRLYASTTAEVYEKTTHDASRLRVLLNPWLWAGAICGLLLAAALYSMFAKRKEFAEKIWPARFLAASLLINAMFVLLLFLWKLPGFVDAIVEHFQEPTPSSRVVDAEDLESERTLENVYNRTADLAPVETPAPDWPSERSNSASASAVNPRAKSLPEDNSLPLSKDLPAHVPKVVVAVRPEPVTPESSRRERLKRHQPNQTELLPIEEDVPQTPKKPLPSMDQPPDLVALNKRDSRTAQPEISLTQNAFEPIEFKPQSVSLAVPKKAAIFPGSKANATPPARPSPREPALQQIAELDASELKTVEKVAEEQLLPALAKGIDQKAPGVPVAGELQDERDSREVDSTLDKLLERPLDLKQSAPKDFALPGKTIPNGLNKAGIPIQLADVGELDELPELKPAESTADQENEQPKQEAPAPPRRTFAEGTPRAPDVDGSSKTPEVPAQVAAFPGPLSNRPLPKLGRTNLKPTADLASFSAPVEVQEPAELYTLLSLRNPETRRELAGVLGHHPLQEAAVKRGLYWLASHQNENGSWSLHAFHENCKSHQGKCSGAGSERSDTAATGLALLPFLGSGYLPGSKEYGPVVTKALDWLLENQHKDGKLQGPDDRQVMYSHGIATIALCEAYAMTQEPRLGEAAKKAVAFIVAAQHRQSGGWRYNPNEPGDTSVVGWQVMALKSAEMANIHVPAETYRNVDRWLKSVEGQGPMRGVFGYTGPSPNPAMTAEGLLCLQFLSEPAASPRLSSGVEYVLKHLPRKDQRHTSYYWYYATQVLYHLQGEAWAIWNPALQKILVESQVTDGPESGTWTPLDQWEKRGGRIYTTSLKLLMLEIEYRHLPLYGGLEPILKK